MLAQAEAVFCSTRRKIVINESFPQFPAVPTFDDFETGFLEGRLVHSA